MSKLSKLFSLIVLFVFVLFSQCAMAETDEFFGIGIEIAKDAFSKKLIVTNVLNDMPAQAANIKIGDEIIAVGNEKVRKMSLCEIVSKIRGEENTSVQITIKENFFVRKKLELTRKKITIDIYRHQLFDSHWAQIAPPCYTDPKIIPMEAAKKFSRKYRKTVLALNEYWFKRKEVFKTGYNACVNYSTKSNQEMCLMHLLDRESAKTSADSALYKFLRN